MDFLSKKQKKEAVFSLAVYPILFALCIVFIFFRGTADLKDTYIINISVDLFGMLMAYVLYVCCLFDAQKNGTDLKYFFYLLNVSFLGLFTDACAWLVDGVPGLRVANIIDNTLNFACAPIQAYFFWLYVSAFLNLEKERYLILDRIMHIGLSAALVARTLNLFFGQYFTISPDGIYSRSSLYPLSMVYIFFALITVVVVIIKERKHLKPYQMAVFGIYTVAPFIAGVFTVFVYGLSISAGVVVLVLLLMYCMLNISQSTEKAIADRDLKVASAIQENMLPKTFPFLPDRKEFDIYATMTPAKEVGGDFYDFFMIDDDHIALVMADVSGKGIPAALFMMASKTMIKNFAVADKTYSPAHILTQVNNQLCEGNDLDLFVTVWFAIVSLSTGDGLASNAGHEHPMLQKNGGLFEAVKYKHSPALAIAEGLQFTEHPFHLEPGDCIFIYTDGLTEANNKSTELFGEERIIDSLNKKPTAMPQDLFVNVNEDIKEFVGKTKQFDDITMLAFRYFGP